MQKQIRNLLTKIAITGIVLSVILQLTTCQSLSKVVKEPVFTFQSVEFAGIDTKGIKMLGKVQVKNPNKFEIPFPETDYSLLVNTNQFLKGTIKKDQRIKAGGSAIIEIPMNVEYVGLFNTIRSLTRGTPQAAYKVALGIKVPTPVFGEKVWNLERNGNLPLPQTPKINSPSIKLGTIDTTKAELIVAMKLENPNSFQIPAPKITYDYMINRNSFIKGNVANQKPLAAKSTSDVEFRMQVNYTDLFRSFASLITAREVSTSLNYSCDFGLSELGFNIVSSALPFTLPIRR